MAKAGRPAAKDTILNNLDKIKQLRREGHTEEQIAKCIGIGYRTWMEYKKKLPQFTQALKESKEALVEDLEKTMYQKALGQIKTKTVKKFIEQTPSGDKTRIEETVQDIPPDSTLLMFSLKNLAPDKWKDTRNFENYNMLKDMQETLENSAGIFEKMQEALGSKDDIQGFIQD